VKHSNTTHVLTRSLCLGALLTCLGCELEVVDPPGGGDVPVRVRQAFEDSCAGSQCHGEGSSPAAGLVLVGDDLAQTLTRASRQVPSLPLVEVGNVAGSYLALKMLPDDALALYGVEREENRMPDVSNPTPEDLDNVAIILAWIAGAELPEITPIEIPEEPSFAVDVWPIIDDSCACHTRENPLGANNELVLLEDVAYANLLDQPSFVLENLPLDPAAGLDPAAWQMNLVTPGSLAESYLWWKVRGYPNDIPGFPAFPEDFEAGTEEGDLPQRMPKSGELAEDQLQLIEQWIRAGALP